MQPKGVCIGRSPHSHCVSFLAFEENRHTIRALRDANGVSRSLACFLLSGIPRFSVRNRSVQKAFQKEKTHRYLRYYLSPALVIHPFRLLLLSVLFVVNWMRDIAMVIPAGVNVEADDHSS